MNALNNIADNMLSQEFPTVAFVSNKFIELLEAGHTLVTMEKKMIMEETVAETETKTTTKTVITKRKPKTEVSLDLIFNDNFQKAIDYWNMYWYKLMTGEYLFYENYTQQFIEGNPDKAIWKKVQCALGIERKFFNRIKDKIIENEPEFSVSWVPNCRERIVNQGGAKILNTSTRWKEDLYPKPRRMKDFDIDLQNNQESLDTWLEFHKNVLCGGNEEMHRYILKWEANLFNGVRNTTVLYLKGGQGIGKSTYTDFLKVHMFRHGEARDLKSSVLLSGFNGELFGLRLGIFEELPSASKHEWEKLDSNMKDMVTNNFLSVRMLYKQPMNVENLGNYIINTNTNPLAHANGRRYCIPDISEHRRGDYKYFGYIRQMCFDDEFADFYRNWVIIHHFDKNFNPQDIPVTDKKQDSFYRVIKKQNPAIYYMCRFWDEEQDDMNVQELVRKTREIVTNLDKTELYKYEHLIQEFDNRFEYCMSVNITDDGQERDELIVCSALYSSYQLWHETSAEMEGIPVASGKRFHAEMMSLGFDAYKKQRKGHNCYQCTPHHIYHKWMVANQFIPV
jgi:hypothetical protein